MQRGAHGTPQAPLGRGAVAEPAAGNEPTHRVSVGRVRAHVRAPGNRRVPAERLFVGVELAPHAQRDGVWNVPPVHPGIRQRVQTRAGGAQVEVLVSAELQRSAPGLVAALRRHPARILVSLRTLESGRFEATFRAAAEGQEGQGGYLARDTVEVGSLGQPARRPESRTQRWRLRAGDEGFEFAPSEGEARPVELRAARAPVRANPGDHPPRPLRADDLGLERAELAELQGSVVTTGTVRIVTLAMIRGDIPPTELRGALPRMLEQARADGVTVLQVRGNFANETFQRVAQRQARQLGGSVSDANGRDLLSFTLAPNERAGERNPAADRGANPGR